MSSQCASITLKGQRCKRNTEGKLCFQHKHNIVHSIHALKFIPIVFSQSWYSNGCCRFKNKFGEFVCNEKEYERGKCYCHEHNKIILKFQTVIIKLLDIAFIYKVNRVTIHSYYKLFKNICLFLLKYKNVIVSFNYNKIINAFIKVIDEHIMDLSFRNESITFSNYKSESYSFYIDEFRDLRKKIISLNETTQIQRERDILVSNNIKIHKLTEIYINQSDTLQAVFSKGIDRHILKFIV